MKGCISIISDVDFLFWAIWAAQGIEKEEHNEKHQLVLAHPVKEDGSLIAANMAVF